MLALLGAVVLAGAIGGITAPTGPRNHLPTSAIINASDGATAQEELRVQQEMATWAFYSMIISACTMFGSFAALVFVRETLQATQQTLTEAQNRNATEMRAYIAVIPNGIETFAGEPTFVGQIEVHNIGKTPANDVSCQVRMKISKYGEKNFETGEYKNLAKRTIAPDGTIRQSSKNRIKLSELQESQPKNIYVYGSVYYSDYSGERRFTRFCHRYNKSVVDREIALSNQGNGGQVLISAKKARHHIHGNDAD